MQSRERLGAVRKENRLGDSSSSWPQENFEAARACDNLNIQTHFFCDQDDAASAFDAGDDCKPWVKADCTVPVPRDLRLLTSIGEPTGVIRIQRAGTNAAPTMLFQSTAGRVISPAKVILRALRWRQLPS